MPPVTDGSSTDHKGAGQNMSEVFMTILCVPSPGQRSIDAITNVFEREVGVHSCDSK